MAGPRTGSLHCNENEIVTLGTLWVWLKSVPLYFVVPERAVTPSSKARPEGRHTAASQPPIVCFYLTRARGRPQNCLASPSHITKCATIVHKARIGCQNEELQRACAHAVGGVE